MTLRHPLVIRAGTGFTPSITLSEASADRNIPLITALDVAVLEGLELKRIGGTDKVVENRFPRLLIAREPGALHVTNCRLLSKADPNHCALIDSKSKTLFVRNSVLTTNVSIGTGWFPQSGGRFGIENCVSANGSISVHYADQVVGERSVRVRGNTLVGNTLNLTLWSNPNLPATGGPPPPFRLELSGNVARWNANAGFLFFNQAGLKDPLSADQAEAILPRLVGLNETWNAYPRGAPYSGSRPTSCPSRASAAGTGQTGTGSGARQAPARWTARSGSTGGDLITRAQSEPEKLTAADFRLRPDSAGYRAGKDGKDLGADIDLVGPGAAYERWKKTPAYQQWLKDTGQVKK